MLVLLLLLALLLLLLLLLQLLLLLLMLLLFLHERGYTPTPGTSHHAKQYTRLKHATRDIIYSTTVPCTESIPLFHYFCLALPRISIPI